MGVLERIESIIRSSLNELLEKTGTPEASIEQLISNMESELADARIQMAAAIREGKRLEVVCANVEQSIEKWQEKAVLAIQNDRDDLAREALIRKRTAATMAEDYKRECELHKEVTISLKSGLKALEIKIQEARKKKDELLMRKRHMEMARILERDAMADKDLELDRLADRIISLDAEMELMEDLGGDELDARLQEEELKEELAKLKDKMESEKQQGEGE